MSTVTDADPIERLEGVVSLGKSTCDVCRAKDPDSRPDDGEYCPEPAIHYINADERRAVDFWSLTVCEYHDAFDNVPGGATHRVVDELEYVGDEPSRMNIAYLHNAVDVVRLE